MFRRPKTESEFAQLEARFFQLTARPEPQPAWKVFTSYAIGLRGRRVEVQFVDERELLNGDKPKQALGSKREAESLISDLVFTPAPDSIERVVACLPTGRVAYHLKNGLQVVDDTKAQMAVHIVRDKELALELVQRRVTVRAAQSSKAYLRRILHKGAWERRVTQALLSCA